MVKFHPKKGTLLCCDFSVGFKAPEMVKIRPVVVVSPKLPGRPELCTVVPISSVEPTPLQQYHHKMNIDSLTPRLQQTDCWAKCDMIYTVALERLDRLREKEKSGKRVYLSKQITKEDLQAIEIAILNGLGLKKFLG
ncbi:type II toxin-antitoxin system PemK/MazF family toxin [Alteromonas marina]|uniref:type II toxin-antitoxin system PemK/MazF family toxin n=1 Tax=Alteromonas sp. KUL150 TaxID=2480805 RepID=UPI0012E66E0B|nr:type II toxin-antitoxin system PemK/MazF family toxin [Alteromonas sp. KUL150]MCP3928058.1 hypothetical protein [Bacteroidota bacterium]MCP4058277.1 hypothetical protein [Pseudoalteromonas sp.]GFD70848.1 hypothetical protein KUL113_02680 [Tenacibaculum sp. KUL113]GFD87771.1 hypothetical protein KUL150_38300 [Alteromonas sp. KUL150]